MQTDVLIVGAGPGGCATAMYLAQKGVRTALLEKEQFPRYKIGESLTGEVGKRLQDLGMTPYMKEAQHPVKLGVDVYGPDGQHTFNVPVMARGTDGSLQTAQTWQVPRDEFDRRMLEEACNRGATHVHAKAESVILDAGTVRGVHARGARGEDIRIQCEVVVDASGPATFLHSAGVTSKKYRGGYSKQLALYSQLKGCVRDEGPQRDNTLILYHQRNHWAWFIPLGEDRVSVGIVVPSEYFTDRNEDMETFFRREIHQLNPELTRRTANLDLLEPVRGSSNYSYAIDRYVGDGFLCVGDAHRFIDPIFSFGVHLAMAEGELAANAIAGSLGSGRSSMTESFLEYQRVCDIGMNSVQELVDAFWNNPLAFSHAAHVKYKEDIVDLFAGRIYEDAPSPGLMALRAINTHSRGA